MTQTRFITPTQFDISKVRFSTKRTTYGKGETNGCINYNYEYESGVVEPLNVFARDVWLSFGLNPYQHTPDAKVKWSTDISFWGMEESDREELLALYKLCMQLDTAIVQFYFDHYEEWYGVKKSLEILQDRYHPMVRDKNPGQYAPVLGVSANPKNGIFQFPVYDFYMQKVGSGRDHAGNALFTEADITHLPKKTKVNALIQPASVWFNQNKFGATVNAKQFQKTFNPVNEMISEPIGALVDTEMIMGN